MIQYVHNAGGTDYMNFYTSATERLRITSSGDVGIGTISPARSPLHIHKSGSDVYLHLTNSTTGSGSGDGFTIHQSGVETLLNNRETGNMRLYTSGTERLRILSDGAVIVGDGTNWAKYVSDANFQITDDTNAKLVISNPGNATYSLAVGTSSDLIIRDESQAADRVNIDYSTGNVTINDGDLIMGTSGHGIDFSATSGSGTSELFDDYEEGSGTTTVSFQTSGSLTLGSSQTFKYVKIGDLVTFSFEFQVATATNPSGAIKIDLPFSSGVGVYSAGAVRLYGVTFTGSPYLEISPSLSYVLVQSSVSGTVTSPINGTGYYFGTISYRTTG